MDATRNRVESTNGWPPRPVDEVFPEVLDTVQVAQLLAFDKRGKNPANGRRSVLGLVNRGMPTLGKIGSTKLYNKAAVLEWLAQRDEPETEG